MEKETEKKKLKKEVVKEKRPPKKQKLETRPYILLKNLKVGDKQKKVGEEIDLTKRAAKFFKSKYYIK